MFYVGLDRRRVIYITEECPDFGGYVVCYNLEQAMSKAADLLSLL